MDNGHGKKGRGRDERVLGRDLAMFEGGREYGGEYRPYGAINRKGRAMRWSKRAVRERLAAVRKRMRAAQTEGGRAWGGYAGALEADQASAVSLRWQPAG
ncbi:uncharacterized protein SCHCODRAFT_02133883 [Schizophyllum commune H4-8]|uniref:uncharacterized protein n=1 Tax=Schizophyllum commune (strain H4-8 / FGSC 9210) TaxID=578458 RepID=UPI00215FBC0E|nr:uncharacterized protein SCHCODRAFT_02133796 [Schizophyllum commune H4-8]XP_050197065.1 uncharacterized protein SCHCODRAFT_02133883 [Schizophyllum commune H4-8]KAI5885196.1 hypothetical protein SCHCODRAFT_02133796 [Schizophyllum commune H4-8]KAI5885202.1 hypothetical protein SCHCODRAFT_02133883 [Schizophyllum commune H4-8]